MKYLLILLIFLPSCTMLNNIKKEMQGDNLKTFLQESVKTEIVEDKSEDKAEVVTEPVIENDLSHVTDWRTLNVSEWAVTCNIRAYFKNETLTIVADEIPFNWPEFEVGPMCKATVGIVIHKDGKVIANTCEFTRSEIKNIPLWKLDAGASGAADHLQSYSKMGGWYWKEGEEIEVFYIANNTRANQSKVKERSNLVKVARQ